MSASYNSQNQAEPTQLKHIGKDHTDISKHNWALNKCRDSYSSFISRYDLLNFFSIAENETKARVRFNILQTMLQPVGPPPKSSGD